MSTDWRSRGNCTGRDPVRQKIVDRMMFPESGANATERDRRERAHREGQAICAGCPVAVACLEAAMAEERGGGSGRYGVRGGLTPDQRDDLYRGSRRRVSKPST